MQLPWHNTPMVAPHLREGSSAEVVHQELLAVLRLQSGVGLSQLWQRHAWAALDQLHLQALGVAVSKDACSPAQSSQGVGVGVDEPAYSAVEGSICCTEDPCLERRERQQCSVGLGRAQSCNCCFRFASIACLNSASLRCCRSASSPTGTTQETVQSGTGPPSTNLAQHNLHPLSRCSGGLDLPLEALLLPRKHHSCVLHVPDSTCMTVGIAED